MAAGEKGSVFYRIPGNIKQQCLPFVLNPNNPLHENFKTSDSIQGAYPQLFTFRSSPLWGPRSADGKDVGILNFIPSSFKRYMEEDISFQLLNGFHVMDGIRNDMPITPHVIFSELPAIQIREYLPDTQLDQTLILFTKMFSDIQTMFTDTNLETADGVKQAIEKFENITWDDVKKFGLQLWSSTKYLFRYMTGQTSNNISFGSDFRNIFSEKLDGTMLFENYTRNFATGSDQPGFKILSMPFILYYLMQSYTTTNVYEIPAQLTNKSMLDSSGGMAGWIDGDPGGMNFSGLLTKIPVVGNFLASITQNIGVNYMPWWSPYSGTNTKEPEVEVSFTLFNDDNESAMVNFIFVNTIVPNNKWIQYGMFQHSSNVYDVKIEGINRLYACAGAFKVEALGNLRTPSNKFIEELIHTRTNKNFSTQPYKITTNNIIKIPDAYKVTLRFQSLLPANFNNYLYSYASNQDIAIEYDTTEIFSKNWTDEKAEQLFDQVSDRMKRAWKASENPNSSSNDIDDAVAGIKKSSNESNESNESTESSDNDNSNLSIPHRLMLRGQ